MTELAFCHPRLGVVSDLANGPVDLCSEQLSVAKAGVVGTSVKLPSATKKKLQPQNEAAKLSNYPEITKL